MSSQEGWRQTTAVPAPNDEVVLEISALSFGESPRLVPDDLDHAHMLAEVNQQLPPIVVHAETLSVIDGRHRVRAAQLRGERTIRAQLFHGDPSEAYLSRGTSQHDPRQAPQPPRAGAGREPDPGHQSRVVRSRDRECLRVVAPHGGQPAKGGPDEPADTARRS